MPFWLFLALWAHLEHGQNFFMSYRNMEFTIPCAFLGKIFGVFVIFLVLFGSFLPFLAPFIKDFEKHIENWRQLSIQAIWRNWVFWPFWLLLGNFWNASLAVLALWTHLENGLNFFMWFLIYWLHMDYVRHDEIQGHSFVYSKAHWKYWNMITQAKIMQDSKTRF